jgi:hypothetical protein
MHRISGQPEIRPDNPAFFISGIRPDKGFNSRIPDTKNGWISGHLEDIAILIHKISNKVLCLTGYPISGF